ncbi:hypothetical protein MSHO_47300 [Mycobacterium shottsii]|uniref:NAD-dependent epimerase/dehydratase domain-containing protein n=1 Tax=Mycobacterium shottsii TaxID=133549 RepID=A0A7I7LHR9_9MYCO|nr:NAD(P)-dependent oxidoreductase [Mycobacterium shottsii]BBX59385.1 hypothetical protein MSHO_47300 [Mycobacterium shottsii]
MSTNEFDRPAPSLSGRTIFITGANGFIGRAMSARFRALGAVVRGVDLAADPAGDVVAGDITRPETWAAAPTGLEGADTVIHTAALLGAAFPLKQAWHVNVLGTSRVLRAAIDAGVRRFVHFSSVAAYGFEFPDGVDETYPVHVNGDVYTDTKVNSEAVVLAAHGAGEIDVTVIRLAMSGVPARCGSVRRSPRCARGLAFRCPTAETASSPRCTSTTSSTAWCSPCHSMMRWARFSTSPTAKVCGAPISSAGWRG